MRRASLGIFVTAWVCVAVISISAHTLPRGGASPPSPPATAVVHYNRDGVSSAPWYYITPFDTGGNRLDIDVAGIFQVGGTYYMHGLSFACAFQYQVASPWCGVNVSTSTDFVNWSVPAHAFDPSGYQSTCGGNSPSTNGCFLDRIVYNAANHNYVMWLNGGGTTQNFRVFTSTTPGSGYVEGTQPSGLPQANNGDESIFIDADNTGYLVYEIYGAGPLHIAKLNATYTDAVPGSDILVNASWGSGDTPYILGPLSGTYHLIWSGACANCRSAAAWRARGGTVNPLGGAAVHHATASSPLGTWTQQADISTDACGGQVVGAYPLTIAGQSVFLLNSTINGATVSSTLPTTLGFIGEYMAPLSISGSTINPVTCQNNVTFGSGTAIAYAPPTASLSDEAFTPGFIATCEIASTIWRFQEFTPPGSATLTLDSVALPIGQSNYNPSLSTTSVGIPNGDFKLSVTTVTTSPADQPGTTLGTQTLTQSTVKFSPTRTVVPFTGVSLTGGTKYGLLLQGTNTQGCYGTGLSALQPSPGIERITSNAGTGWSTEGNSIRFAVNWH